MRALHILLTMNGLGVVFGGGNNLNPDAIEAKLDVGDLSDLRRLEGLNTPEAVFLLARTTVRYSDPRPAKKYPGVWQAAAQSLARMPGACEVLGEACRMEVRNFDAGEEREKYFEALRLVRSKEAVRTVGELLFDEDDLVIGDGKCVAPNLGSNAACARGTLISWLARFLAFEERLTEVAGSVSVSRR